MYEPKIEKIWIIHTEKLTPSQAEKHLKEQMKRLNRPFSLSGKTQPS